MNPPKPIIPRLARPAKPASGFTLVEFLCASALLAILLGTATLATRSGPRAIRTGNVRSDLQTRAARCLERISSALLAASQDSLAGFPETPLFGESFTCDVVEGVSPKDGSITWETLRVALELVPGETDNGLDDDDNGLVDERRIVLVRGWGGPDEHSVILCNGVREYLEGEGPDGIDENGNTLIDERGLCFERDREKLTIRLTLEALDLEGRLAVRTVATTVHLRN